MYINNDINYLKYLKDKHIYIFGAGIRGKNCLYKLKKENIQVTGFIDNNKKLQAEKIEHYSVLSFEQFVHLNSVEIMIIICSRFEMEIKKQLLENNVFNFISESQIDFGGGAEYYDEKYFEYQQRMGEFGGIVKSKLFTPYISEEDFVVEFGSGGGFLLNNLTARRKLGIEINETARQSAKRLGIDSIRSAEELENDSVDVIISTSVLEHVENPLETLRILHKKLRINGKIIFHVPNESCDTEYSRSEVNNHLYTWNCLNLGNLFKAAGFFVHSVEKIQSVWPHHYYEIKEEVSEELFDEICLLGGKAFNENSCLIVAYK